MTELWTKLAYGYGNIPVFSLDTYTHGMTMANRHKSNVTAKTAIQLCC